MVDFREATPVMAHEVDSLDDPLREIRERIEVAAYERFLSRGSVHGQDLDDWLSAESALLIRPQLNTGANDDEIIAVARFAESGFGDLEVFATPHAALLTSFNNEQRQVFAVFHFPRPILVRSIDAEVEGDVFHLLANVANATPSARPHVA
jgi:hypothetical protein